MKLTFLGTGTSSGVPVIGCACKVCLSKDPKDSRLRCAALLETNTERILIDSGPDIRTQLLRYNIQSLSAILITHSHFDHIMGLDELRPFSWYKALELYADSSALKDIKRVFSYIFDNTNIQIGGGLTQFKDIIIEHYQTFYINDITITPLLVMHGKLPITGYKINNLAYLTDVKSLPIETLQQIQNIDTLVINCLRIQTHNTHLNLEEVLKLTQQIQAKKTYLIHMNHELSHQNWCDILPTNIHVAYDGLTISII
ncbi:MAG: MBL fold metallo-hydrolase [Spirochaetota bacterium]|nr:MBL fold metallo-hydrolase [Spirochaetota bacterium]